MPTKKSKGSSDPSSTLHIYTRVSTVAQRDEGTSLQTQLELGKKKAQSLGFGYKHWDEGGKSSNHENIADRPVLNDLFQSIKHGDVKHIYVYDQSRLSRNDSVASGIRYECNKQGVTLYTKDGQFDLSNPQDKFLKQILDSLAEFDNAARAERTRLGKLNRAQTGFWHGGPPPFGFKLESKRLVLHKEEAKWVKRIFDEAIKGTSTIAIKKILDTKGMPPRRGGMWSLGSIQSLLKNTHYTGVYTFTDKKSGKTVSVSCPVIVDEVQWKAVQLARTREQGRTLQKNRTKKFYLLRDLMFCGHCGRPIQGRLKPTKNEALYYCPNKERQWVVNGGSKTPWERGTGCGMDRSLNIHDADKLIFDLVRQVHTDSSLLKEEVKNRVLKEQGVAVALSEGKVKELQLSIRRIKPQLAQAQDVLGTVEASYELGDINKSVYEAKVRTIKQKIEQLETSLNNQQLQLQGIASDRKWVDWLKAFGDEVKSLDSLEDEKRKTYIAGLVDRIEVRYLKDSNEHQLTVQFRLPVVNDGIRYKSAQDKAQGYRTVKGRKTTDVVIQKKDPRWRKAGDLATPLQNHSVTVE